ncbi:MAG: right-handed parallel beta-helix repeat-containing protein [Dehalococcoidia bacterium]|nr:right-handed parallel beta-helix repeat-containing protein [Dehalococcoidia bacterium]
MGKIVSILLALALVLSVGLVTTMPVQAAVSQSQVTVSPVRTGQVAQYTIVFGITASLTAGVDSITVDFPTDTTVPGTGNYTTGDITINANNVSSGDITVAGQKLTMKSPVTIVAPATVTVVFKTDAGIINPTTTGDYKLKVNTSLLADQNPVESATYAIRDLPAVTAVSPGKGNVDGTMWVEIAGTSFMGDSDTNASDTTISFSVGADVLQTKYISVTEIDVQIKVKAVGIFPVTAQTPAGNSTTNGSFTANAAGTKQVDVWQKYTPTDIIFDGDTLVFHSTTSSITAAISAASADYTLMAHSGAYVEDLLINKAGLALMSVSGKDATTIKGVQNVPEASWPLAKPNIDILSDGVRISGFTIAGPDYQAGYYTSGMVIGGSNVEIYGNAFEVTAAMTLDEISQAITTYHENAIPGVDVSGLNIHNNSLTPLFSGSTAGYEGIYINYSVATADVTIADNTFGGEVVRAITTECSDTVISGNTIITGLGPGLPGGYIGILVRDYFGVAQDSVSIVGNTVKGSASGKGFQVGIQIGRTGQTLTNISVTRNTVQDNETGVLVRASAGGVGVNYNNIAGNTELGLNNTDSVKLDALYNWWGLAIGPHHDTRNPSGQLNAVTGNVDFSPWLYKPQEQFAHDAPCLAGSVVLDNEAEEIQLGSYAGGWNSFSTPITLDGSANTVSELLALAAASNLYILRAQRFDLATQQWVLVILNNSVYGADYQIKPGEGFYVQVRTRGSLPILVATGTTAPPMRDLAAGWNLIGMSSIQAQTVATALSGVSYSMVLSPKPPNDVAWSVPPAGAGDKEVLVGQAYWVAMGESGKLFGFTYTPVASDMTWDLNQ